MTDTLAKPFTLTPLPFAEDALEPLISARTLQFHHGKHHKTYVDTLNTLIAGTPFEGESLEAIITATDGDAGQAKIFNNAAQVWNHDFYWQCLSPHQQTPSGELGAAITRDFGSLADCEAALAKAAIDRFGTGWGWLVKDRAGRLSVMSTPDAEVPFTRGLTPLLTIDVWEHAYYLDVQNRRADHVNALVAGHLNWGFAARNFAAA
jgi:Fe-Mn family superoxide dismutase